MKWQLMPNKVIIIGAHAAGVDAASACRKKDRTAPEECRRRN